MKCIKVDCWCHPNNPASTDPPYCPCPGEKCGSFVSESSKEYKKLWQN